jgi:hypothetical protein
MTKAALLLVGRHVSSWESNGERSLAVKLGDSRGFDYASFFCLCFVRLRSTSYSHSDAYGTAQKPYRARLGLPLYRDKTQ